MTSTGTPAFIKFEARPMWSNWVLYKPGFKLSLDMHLRNTALTWFGLTGLPSLKMKNTSLSVRYPCLQTVMNF